MAFSTYPDGYIKSDIVLSVGLLVSNNIKYIRRALEGLKPLLEAVPSELVIVDTVGEEKSDGSIAVCREFTDKIYHFDWINDFAAARNEILKHCSGEWFMFQDDDEVFEDVSEFIAFFRSKDRYKYNSGFYYTCDMLPDGGTSKAVIGRLVRRKPDTHFVWKIHESFNEANLPGKQFESRILHYGYHFETEEERLKKFVRNTTILEEEIKEHPGVPRLCAQMVQEYMTVESKRDEGKALMEKYLTELEKNGALSFSMSQWIIAAGSRYYLMKDDTEGMMEYIDSAEKKYKLSEACKLTLYSNIIEAGIFKGGIPRERVERACDDYFKICDFFTTHPEERLVQMQLDFPKFIEDEFRNGMAEAAAQYKNAAGKYEEALMYWKRVNFSQLKKPWEFKEFILETLQHLEDPKYLEEYYRAFMRPGVFEKGNEKFLPQDLYKKKFKESKE